jgi:hypothetical protein
LCFDGGNFDVKAALMTYPEAFELLEHGTPPGTLGTVPGRLVCLVVTHGMYEVTRPGSGHRGGYTPPPPEITERWLFMVCDSRTGGGFWLGGKDKEIVLPEQ